MSSLRLRAAANLRAEMARQRKTSSELAHVISISQSSASRRMTGEVTMDLDELGRISEWLKLPVERLLQDVAA